MFATRLYVEAYEGANFFETGVNPARIPSFFKKIETPFDLYFEALCDNCFFYWLNDYVYNDFFELKFLQSLLKLSIFNFRSLLVSS